jgi:hypothetical protein
MQKGNPKSKIEVRAFSGYTLKNRYKRDDRRDLVIEQLFSKSKRSVRGYKWFSVTPRERNILFQIADQLGPRIGNTIRGVLGPLNAPFQRLIRILFDRKLVWMGSPSAFWQATTYIVSIVYKQSYMVLTRKSGLSSIQAKQIAESSARVFCNFMLTTRLSYQMASYEAGVEQPEELSEDDIRALEEAELEEARLGEAAGIDMSQVNTVARYIVSAFRRLRIQQILQGINGMTYRLIAYAFTVNSSNSSNFNWVRYARGTHAYTEIIKAITDVIIENVDEVLSSVTPEPAAPGVPARRKQQRRSYSEGMQYEEEMPYREDLEEGYEEYEDEDADVYYRDEDYEEDYEEDGYDEGYEGESYEDVDYEEDYEGESYEDVIHEDDYEEEDYEDDYEEGYEDLIAPDLEPETGDYELPEYGESTQIEPVYDEDEGDGQLVETLRSIEPSLNAFRLADKFLKTRTFSNSISLKRNFYNFLVNEFVNTRAFNKKEEKEMEEAAAEIVDKLDAVAEDVKDIRTMLAKAIEAMDVATADEGSEDSEESNDSGSSWDDFWRSDDSDEREGREEEEDEGEGKEEADEESDEAESDEEGEDEKGYRGYYARLRRYKKRGMRVPKKAAKPTKKPKAKGI